MSRLDGTGEIDGWCHRCGVELVDYQHSMHDFCARCRERPDVRAELAASRQLSKDAFEASQKKD